MRDKLLLQLEGDLRKIPCSSTTHNTSKVLTYSWGTREVCTITLHLPVSNLIENKESLAEIAGYPTRDFGFGKGTFSGRCTIQVTPKNDKYYLNVITKLGKWASSGAIDDKKSLVTIEGNFSGEGQLELMRNDVRVFHIEDNKTRFFLKRALGSFTPTGQFRIETEVWGSFDQVLEATRYLGSPEWWSLKTATNLNLSGSELQGSFTENYILGSKDQPEVFWQSLDETIIMTRMEGDIYNVDHLLCEISGHEGLYSGELVMEPPNVKYWNGKWSYYTMHGASELSIDVSLPSAKGNDVPVRLVVNGIDCVGYFTGDYCLNQSQDEFIPAGNGEWIGETDSGTVRITGTWVVDSNNEEASFKRGSIQGDDSSQQGTWKHNSIWRGKVENCTESDIVKYDAYGAGAYSGAVVGGRAFGYGTFKTPNILYEGNWEDGLPHGKGKMTYFVPDSSESTGKFVGTWIAGDLNGPGIFQWIDGVATFREYIKGKLIVERSAPINPAKLDSILRIYLPADEETNLQKIVEKEKTIKKRRASVAVFDYKIPRSKR